MGAGNDVLIGAFILNDSDLPKLAVKSASDQLRQMCLSQLTASDELAQTSSIHPALWVCMYIYKYMYIHIYMNMYIYIYIYIRRPLLGRRQ